jgi:hypothetical protein
MVAFIGTQSRGGLLAFGTCAIATFIWYLYHKKYTLALVIGTVFTIAVGIWVFTVFALKIEKFTVSLAGEKVKGSAYGQSLAGRMEQQRELATIGMRLPWFGTGPNARLLPGAGAKYQSWSAFTHTGPTDTMYGYVFAQFGMIGLVFLVVMQSYFLTYIRRGTAYRPFAFAAFFIGVAFTAHGLAEFLLYQRTFIVMNLLAAFASAPDLVTEKGKTLYRRIIRAPVAQA